MISMTVATNFIGAFSSKNKIESSKHDKLLLHKKVYFSYSLMLNIDDAKYHYSHKKINNVKCYIFPITIRNTCEPL